MKPALVRRLVESKRSGLFLLDFFPTPSAIALFISLRGDDAGGHGYFSGGPYLRHGYRYFPWPVHPLPSKRPDDGTWR